MKRRQIARIREAQRLEVVQLLVDLLSENDDRFDTIVHLAASLLEPPIVLITLIEENRQIVVAGHGTELRELPRRLSCCPDAMEPSGPLIVQDLLHDARFQGLAPVTGFPHLRFYAGFPLWLSDGHCVGTLCAMDTRPRRLPLQQFQALGMMGSIVIDEFKQITPKDTLDARSRATEIIQERMQYVSDFLSSEDPAIDAG